ncbi:MAG: hypothetical protein KatS3mg101_0997 [Patescibacteria group bacterium]|nr:MAG: hypothetical protein KatS3mg101_0997 [Patescibacteria group bacterium]
MSETQDIEKYTKLQRIMNIFQKISQISWWYDQAKKRYPAPEAMTTDEIDKLTQYLLTLGDDLEDAYKDWKKEAKNYGN